MTPQEKANNIEITVNDNPNQGACNIVEHFKDEWGTSGQEIDSIKTTFNDDAYEDGITVTEKDTGNVIIQLKGQRALLLATLKEALILYLGIKVTK